MKFELVEEDNINVTKQTYYYEYEEYEEEDKGPETMIEDILAHEAFPELDELVIGNWGVWNDGCQPIIDGIIENKEKFSHIQKVFIGNMDYEECEVSWIEQGNYSKLWAAMPQLKELTIKGSNELDLGEICHEELEALTIICGGLPTSVIQSIQNAKLPKLKKLLLFIGVEGYGFDGDENTVKELLTQAQFPELTYLGITDSEIQDELTEIVLNSKFMGQLTTLDLSNGTLTDKGAALLLEKLPQYPNITKLDVHHNFLSTKMAKKLEQLPIEVDASEIEQASSYDGNVYTYAMLTE